PVAEDLVPLDPGRAVERIVRILRRQVRVGPQRRVEVGVVDQAIAAARAVEPGRDVEAVLGEGHLLRPEPVLGQPVEDELAGGTLAPGRAVDVAEGEREVDDLVPIDAGDDLVGGHWAASLGAGGAADAPDGWVGGSADDRAAGD